MRAILAEKTEAGFACRLADLDEASLPDGDVTLAVAYSTVNYKDALAITNTSPIVRKWPMVVGIDGAGIVERSSHPKFRPGDAVIHTGWGVGESHWGCLAEKARLHGDWLVPLPAGMTARQAMAAGTAGFTAMLSALALRRHGLRPGDGEILVTGAAGGVGGFAVAILATWGYRVVASTGRTSEAAYLEQLGASEIIDRATLATPGRPLERERWAGVVDSVGSVTLANACAATREGGIVAACGLAGGMDFPATVAPFILRGVTLAGIESVRAKRELRLEAWKELAPILKGPRLADAITEIGLDEVIGKAPDVLAGKVRGRLVVRVAGAA